MRSGLTLSIDTQCTSNMHYLQEALEERLWGCFYSMYFPHVHFLFLSKIQTAIQNVQLSHDESGIAPIYYHMKLGKLKISCSLYYG